MRLSHSGMFITRLAYLILALIASIYTGRAFIKMSDLLEPGGDISKNSFYLFKKRIRDKLTQNGLLNKLDSASEIVRRKLLDQMSNIHGETVSLSRVNSVFGVFVWAQNLCSDMQNVLKVVLREQAELRDRGELSLTIWAQKSAELAPLTFYMPNDPIRDIRVFQSIICCGSTQLIFELRGPIKAPRDPQVLFFHVKQLSGRFACPKIDFKLIQKHQKLNYRGTMIQFHHVYLTSSQYRRFARRFYHVIDR